MTDNTRHIIRKTPLNEPEDMAVRSACAAIGQQFGPMNRMLLLQFAAQINGTPPVTNKRWPRHGHIAQVPRCPGRRVGAHVHKRL